MLRNIGTIIKKAKYVFIALLVSLYFNLEVMAYKDSPIGWASYNDLGCNGTTGGAGGPTVTATTQAELIQYATSVTAGPLIIQVQGTINLTQRVDISPNKTLIGIGTNPTITGYNLRIRGEDSGGVPLGYNIIVRNLIIAEHSGGDSDGLTIQDAAHHIWVDHCTFYDCADGCLDITHGSEYITISWCKFYYVNQSSHRNVNLIGNSDDSDDDMGKLHVTFHHNWWSSLCDQRMPSVRYGTVHVFNNYYDCPGNLYCIRTRLYAQCLVENNYFKEVQNPWERYITSAGGDPGLLYASGNIMDNVTWNDTYDPGQIILIDGNDTVFTPPYSYTLDDAKFIPIIVQYGAGCDGNEGYPPHWLFGYYGDFDINGIVDENDLITFTDYWLDTNDISDINDADYDEDGIVNYYEYALFANNWLYIPPDTTAPNAPLNLWAAAGDAAVVLDWADNNEPDFDGYNIYRSTTSGSGYTKVNSELLTSSNYTDNTVMNDTMYYYVVTALDTNLNESADSDEACAVPSSDANSITIQENVTGFCGVDGVIETEHTGYTGSGFCDTVNGTGNGIDWNINIASAGTYSFVWRFANGSSARTAKLIINGSDAVTGISFPGTGAWKTWNTLSVDVALTSGIKSIRLEATNSAGLANIDYLMVTGDAPEIALCP